ncbi:MAG: NAD(P)-dependent oxidoreductase [Candidatus Izemoplasmatales bacterium]|uniref:NAD(P)-binding domain-containing protein n=1 Tax=Hujiaoplasma nucleasis TaxID=2725268 RepID=A0A7L6N3V7_9MOLU|nr:NAD(P)-dependent oxidoreductase [Hujiaoplasma nucleasis]QLY40930.1 NAD(P)-binding domain-containing protein [Hujiaoplasma nucleasis]
MKIFIDKRFIPRERYDELVDRYSEHELVHDLHKHKDIEIFFGLNATLLEVDLSDYKKLKWIQLYMAGFDNVDVESLKRKNILVSNARDIFSITIAEDIIAKISFFNRNTREFLDDMKIKAWNPIPKDYEIWHSNIGIVGTGSIGLETAKRLKSFQPKKIMGHRRENKAVQYFDEIYVGDQGLEEMIKQADYLILAIPLNSDTKYMIDKEKLLLMKEEALLINVARGQVIVQDDLIQVLETKKIRGAALDVTDPEPLPKDSKLWTLDNCFITPHNASSSRHMKTRLFELTLENLDLYLKGQEVKYLL